MNDVPPSSGRHLAGALATAMLTGAFAALAVPEVLGTGRFGPTGFLVLACLGLSGPILGLVLFARLSPRPALAGLAQFLGLAGLAMPLAVLAARLGHRPGLDRLALPVASLVGGWLTGLFFGLALGAVLPGARRYPRLDDRPRLGLALLTAAVLAGVGFIRFVAGPRLSVLNIALDLTLGCAVVGIACAAGTPAANRRLETWLSVLALLAILALPLSGVLDERSRHWADPSAPVADPARPAPAMPPFPSNTP